VSTVRWFNPHQPQTLQSAVVLLYVLTIPLLIGAIAGGVQVYGLLLILLSGGSGIGIANDKRWAYALGIVAAVLPFAFLIFVAVRYHLVAVNWIALAFQLALFVLLVHRQSREYVRIWFE
jgi:hypothetical protein